LRDGWRGLHGWSVYLKRFSREGPGRRFLYWGPWKIGQERLQIWASLTIGVPLRLRVTWNEAHIQGMMNGGGP
jgi:hypothetical protein